jgi:hypothetical protein
VKNPLGGIGAGEALFKRDRGRSDHFLCLRHFLVPYTLPLLRDCICNRPCRAESRPRPDRNAAAHTDVLLSVSRWRVLLGAVLARRVLLLPTTACVPPARVRALRPDAADFA